MVNYLSRLAKLHLKQVVIIVLIFALFTCQKKPRLDKNTIFIIGDEKISIGEFRNMYELDPAFPGYRRGQAGLKEYLDVLADKFLAEKLAQKEGILDNIHFKQQLDYQRKKAIIQSFYQREVVNNIEVTESELRDAYHKMGIQLHVKHLFTPDKYQAEDAFQTLESGVPFDTLAKDFFKNVDPEKGGADLGEIGWGELEPSLEDAVYKLKAGEYSKPVKSRWGYHILLLMDRKQNLMPTESDYMEKRSRILIKLKRRKEELEAGKYLKEYLDPFQIKVKNGAFLKIVRILGIYDENTSQVRFQKFQPITDEQISLLRDRLTADLNEVFMSSNKSNWSIKDFLNKVSKLPLEHRPQLSSIARFKDDIGLMIRNEFLIEEAMQRGMHKSAKVDSTVREYVREIAYHHYLKDIYQNMGAPQEIIDYFDVKNSNGNKNKHIPNDILPGMSTIESYRYYYAGRELHRKLLMKFPDVEMQMNNELVAQESRNINWDNPIRMFVVQKN
jgi:hypothetical protein